MGREPGPRRTRPPREFRPPTDAKDHAAPAPGPARPVPLLALQRAAGNRAVNALIAENRARTSAGGVPVQRDSAADGRAGADPGTADPKNLAPRLPDLGPTAVMVQDPEPNPLPHRGGDTWDLEYQMYGKPLVFSGLDDEGVIKKLQFFYLSLLDDMRNGQQAQEHWRQDMGSSFGTRWAAAASSIAGGADWPDPGHWLEVDKQIFDAFLLLRESRWAVMAARNEPLDADARAQAKPLTEDRVTEVVGILERGDRAAANAWEDWKRFLADTDRGAARAVTGLKVAKVAGAVAVTYLTAGLAAEAQLGFWGTSAALAASGGTYAAEQDLAGQVGEMIFGDRDHIDWGSVAKAGAINAAAGFVGGVVGGKFAGILGNSLGKMVGRLSPEVMQAFGVEGSQLLTNGERIFVQWVGNVASSPFQTSTTVLMQSALDRRWTVTSTGDFFDLVLHDLVVNGSIGGFFSLAHAAGPGSGPTVEAVGPTEGGNGRGGDGAGGGVAPPGRPTLRGMGAAGPAGENARPARQSGDTLTGMGAAGPAGENARPARQSGDTLTGMGAAGPAGENARPARQSGDTLTGMGATGARTLEIEMPAEYVGRPARVHEHAELTGPIDRDPGQRMSVSGYPGSLPEGYGVFRTEVRLPSGEVVPAAVKIYPGELASRYESEVAGAMAAARTGLGPRFYGRIPVATDANVARHGQPDLAFAMEPVDGAFAHPGVEPGDPGYVAAAAESAQAAGRITDQTMRDVHDFAAAILDQGHYYGGSHGGEVQGLIGPDGRWNPIDFQGLNELPTDPTARAAAIEEQNTWVQDEINDLRRARDEHAGVFDEEPTDPGR